MGGSTSKEKPRRSAGPARGAGPIAPATFRRRCLLAPLPGGGVLLDLESGSFYRLNPSALSVCAVWASSRTSSQGRARVARTLGIPVSRAAREIDVMLAALGPRRRRSHARNPISFTADASGFVMRHGGQAVLKIAPSGETVRLLSPLGSRDAAQDLLYAAPHVLGLQGHTVLHAAAVRWPGDPSDKPTVQAPITVLVGPTGAGKTTLARLLVRQGAALVSEDLLVLSRGATHAVLGGERIVRDWAARMARSFHRDADRPVDVRSLGRLVDGPSAPLGKLLFIDLGRSAGKGMDVAPLGPADTLVLLLENSFAELGQRDIWLRVFEVCQELAQRLLASQLRLPDGREALRVALKRFGRPLTAARRDGDPSGPTPG